jgi:hypothetical protein
MYTTAAATSAAERGHQQAVSWALALHCGFFAFLKLTCAEKDRLTRWIFFQGLKK